MPSPTQVGLTTLRKEDNIRQTEVPLAAFPPTESGLTHTSLQSCLIGLISGALFLQSQEGLFLKGKTYKEEIKHGQG